MSVVTQRILALAVHGSEDIMISHCRSGHVYLNPHPAQVDLLKGEAARSGLLDLTDSLRQLAPFEEVFPISAARGHGVAQLADYLLDRWQLLSVVIALPTA